MNGISNRTVRMGVGIALATALLSGVSVFVNSFGVKRVPDPFVFTTAKNLIVAMLLVAAIGSWIARDEFKRLSASNWTKMAILGAVGGGIPFLMFFYGLREASAPSAAFMHKTLFIWVTILAIPILKERLGAVQVTALVVLLFGNLAVGFRASTFEFGKPELFTLGATMIWAVEAVVARKFLSDGMSTIVAAVGRMGFGALVMLGFIVVTGRGDAFASMNVSQWGWVLLTSVFLVAYVVGYYSALKSAPATVVASVLVIGSVVTSGLHYAFNNRTYEPTQIAGLAILLIGAATLAYWTWSTGNQTHGSSEQEVELERG